MVLGSKPKRVNVLSRSALGVALAFGVVAGGVMTAEPALAQKRDKNAGQMKLSPEFQKLAAPLSQAIEAAKAKPAVTGAKGNPAALATALAAEKAQLDPAFAAATSPDDKFVAGQLAVSLGGLAEDPALQRRGLQAMVDSGKAAPADLPKFQFFLGQLAFQAKDYAGARAALQAAQSAGYKDNDIEALLAESYINDNQAQQGLIVLKQAIDARQEAGKPAPDSWYKRGLSVAYKAKLLDQASVFSIGLVQAYPSTQNWGGAITVVREVGKFSLQDTLDLMRLMARTNSFAEGRDYSEYIEAADARRLPGEVQKVIEAGFASGKLTSSPFITEQKGIADQKVAADRASLPASETAARAPGATTANITGTADALLSYGESAKAEQLYTVALSKPDADQPRVLTRLGIAQTDQGKYAAAQETFAKITTGPRKPIAQLWAIYAGQKAAGGAAPAAAKPAS
jgi:hypothetical protein